MRTKDMCMIDSSKCDQKRPSCSQCIRANKTCYGYRDPLSMMFKNESAVVAKKAEKRYETLAMQKTPTTTKIKRPSPSSDIPETWVSDHDWFSPQMDTHIDPCTRYPTPESMTHEAIVPSIEDQALGFFIGNYVAKPTIVPRGQFEWIPELLSQSNTEEIIRSSVSAASLAALANATKSPGVMRQAQAAYVSALRITNDALRIKETAVQDSTLLSVIMLGTYENLVFQDRRSVQAWARHIDGACALLNLRGKEQFKSDLGRRMFHQFYGVILLVALETGRAVHPGMYDLYQVMNPTSDYSVHGRQWTTRMINVLHDAITLNQDKHSDPRTMVNIALSINRELGKLKKLMPHIWNYETIRLEQPSEYLYGDIYQFYLDPWIAQMWNNIKSCRMYLFKIVRENLVRGCTQFNPPIFSHDEYEFNKTTAEEIVQSTAASIVASVPQITGMIPFPDLSTARRRASNPELEESSAVFTIQPPGTYLDPTQSTQMVHVIWPLYAAGQTDLATPELRQWAIDMLHFVALRIGTRQAVVLAEELKAIQRTRLLTATSGDCI